MKRIFLGIDLNNDLKSKIEDLKKKSGFLNLPIKLVEQKNSHIALKFLDQLSDEQIDELINTISEELNIFKSFEVKIDNCFVFPNLDNAKVLALKVLSPNLSGLAMKLFNRFQDFKFIKPEDRPYTPHITLGRFKNGLTDLEKEKVLNIQFKNDFKVDSIQLFESQLTNNGPIYSIIRDFNLK